MGRDQILHYLATLPDDGALPLEHEREFKLAKQIMKVSDCMLAALESLQIHKLCDYIYNLATTFHDFYNECYVVQKTADGMSIGQ